MIPLHALSGQAGEKIRGIGTMRTYVKDVSRFVTYCHQEHGIRDLGQITPEMADRYLTVLHDRECSGGYIGRVKAALGWLSKALEGKERAVGALPLVIPGGGFHSDKRPERAYTPEIGAQVQAEVSKAQDKQFGQVVALQRAAGLRVKEAANIRARDIDPQACIIHVRKGTKGGRDRDVKVDPQHRQLLADLKAQGERQRDGHVFRGRGSLPDRTQDAVYKACKRLEIESYGTHGFRKEWAQTRYRELRAQGLDDQEARREVATQLGHGRIQVLDHYLP